MRPEEEQNTRDSPPKPVIFLLDNSLLHSSTGVFARSPENNLAWGCSCAKVINGLGTPGREEGASPFHLRSVENSKMWPPGQTGLT